MAVAYFEAAILVLQMVLWTQANKQTRLSRLWRQRQTMFLEMNVVYFSRHSPLSYGFVVIMPSDAYMQFPLK